MTADKEQPPRLPKDHGHPNQPPINSDSRDGTPRIGQIIAMAAIGLFSLFSYEIARPTIKTLFQQSYGAENEPWAWIGMGIAVTLVVMLYGKAAQRHTLNALGVRTILLIIATLSILTCGVALQLPGAVFLLYIWKDIYIVLIIELFWSFANSSLKFNSAKWLYGGYCFLGGIGAALGGTVAMELGKIEFGLLNSLIFVFIPLLLCAVCPRFCPKIARSNAQEKPSLVAGFKTVRDSAYLGLLLSVIVLSQICITLVDYDFSVLFQTLYTDKSVRQTELASVYRWINLSAMGLQIVTGFILVMLRLKGTLVSIPTVLGSAIALFLLAPTLGLSVVGIMVFTKIASKAMDYSIFRATKELLYLPLSVKERVEGKAVVDVMGYRVAKAAASALVLFVTPLVTVPYVSSMMALFLSVIWCTLVVRLVSRHAQLTAGDHS